MYRSVNPFVLGPLGQTPTIDVSGLLSILPPPCNDPQALLGMLMQATPTVASTGDPMIEISTRLTAFMAQINMAPTELMTPVGGQKLCNALQSQAGGGGGGVVVEPPAPPEEGLDNKKMAIGLGGLAVLGGLLYLVTKKN